MRLAPILIAGMILSGCDITFGANGPVVTPSDSLVGQLVPVRRNPAPAAQDRTAAPGQPASTGVDADAPREPVSLAALMATGALPIGVTRAQVAAFAEAVADAGCVISTRGQRAAIQGQTGFDTDKLDSIRDYLWRAGQLDRNSGFYTLRTGRCGDA